MPKIAKENKFISDGSTFLFHSTPFYANYEAYDNKSFNYAYGKKLYNIENFYYLNGDQLDFPFHHPNCTIDNNTFFMDLFEPICLEPNDECN